MKNKKNGLLISVFAASWIIIASKLIGFIKEIIVASYFGTTGDTDVLSLSQGIISDIKYVLVQVLLTSFIAIYVNVKNKSEDEAKQFTSGVLKVSIFITLGVVILLELLAVPLSYLLAPGFDAEGRSTLAYYIRVYAPTLIAFVSIAVFNAVLSANKKFIPGQLEGLFQSAIIISIIVLFSSSLGIKSLFYSFFVFALVNLVFMFFCSRKHIKYSLDSDWKNQNIKDMLKMAAPLLIGYSAVYINQMVDKVLMSTLETGTITAMGYAATLHNIVGAFIVTFASIVFPYIADSLAEKKIEKANTLINSIIVLLVVVFLPVSILTIANSKDIVTIVFERGAFDSKSVTITSYALLGYGFGFLPLIIKEVFSRFLFANAQSKLPMRNSVISIAVNIALSIVLCKTIGVIGVTIATSFSCLLCGILDYFSAKRYGYKFSFSADKSSFLFLLIGIVLSIIACVFGNAILQGYSSVIRLIIIFVAVVLVYFPMAFPILKSEIRIIKGKNNSHALTNDSLNTD